MIVWLGWGKFFAEDDLQVKESESCREENEGRWKKGRGGGRAAQMVNQGRKSLEQESWQRTSWG